MARVQYLGEVTGNNMQVTPLQLLEMVARDLEADPAKGICIQVVRDAPDGGPGVIVDRYRASVPYFVEVTVAAQTLHRLLDPPE